MGSVFSRLFDRQSQSQDSVLAVSDDSHSTSAGRKASIVLAIAAVVVYLSVALRFAFLNPPFEAPDEPHHLAYVNYVINHHAIPNQLVDSQRVFAQGYQPPLYYFICAGITTVVHGGPIRLRLALKPRSQRTPLWYYHPAGGGFATAGDRRAFYLLRIISMLFGLGVVVCAYGIGRLVYSDSVWAGIPPLLIAALPQFAFVSSSISCDTLANLCAAAAFFFIYAGLRTPERRSVYVGLGVTLGIGFLTKKAVIPIPVGASVWFAYLAIKNRWCMKTILKRIALVAVPLFMLWSPLAIRNYLVFGTFTTGWVDAIATRLWQWPSPISLSDQYFQGHFQLRLLQTFVGNFGWVNTPMSDSVYTGFAIFLLIAGIGLLLHRPTPAVLLAALFTIIYLGGFVYYNTLYPQAQGRYLFPALTTAALVVTHGLQGLATFPRRCRVAITLHSTA